MKKIIVAIVSAFCAVAQADFAGKDPRVPGFIEKNFTPPLRVMIIGAHPDDADLRCGGLAIKLSKAGHRVWFVSLTNGNKGHQFMDSNALAKRREGETAAAAKVFGIERYYVSDTPDCELEATVKERAKLTKIIRGFAPHIIITHRPNDYHTDHRATGVLVQDATYLLGVPLWCPDAPVPETLPTVLYMGDHFTLPVRFRPDFVLDISEHEDQIARAAACHESQLFEWLVPERGIKLEDVPKGADERIAFVKKHFLGHYRFYANGFNKAVQNAYPERKPTMAEAYEISQYGRRPTKTEREILESIGGKWIKHTR